MVRSLNPAQIGPDTPLRLDVAAKVAFPGGGVTASSLRNERKAGRLLTEMVANKEFTTLRDIQEMRKLCRVKQKEPGCGSNPKSETETGGSSIEPHGSSVTDRGRSGRAALQESVKARKESSPATSPANIKQTGAPVVVPLKSSL
jgi:hypothetical protein